MCAAYPITFSLVRPRHDPTFIANQLFCTVVPGIQWESRPLRSAWVVQRMAGSRATRAMETLTMTIMLPMMTRDGARCSG